MTRCAKFHHLFDEVGDFCGMSPTAISQYKAYREQVNKLVKLGIEEDFIFENFPEGPGRVLSNIKDDETRTRALNYVAARLKKGEKVTAGDMHKTLALWQSESGKSCAVGKRGANLGKPTFTNVKSNTTDNDVKKPEPAPAPAESPAADQTIAESHKLSEQIAGSVPQETSLNKIPGCLGNGGCPKGKFRQEGTADGGLISVCGESGTPIMELPDKSCPLDKCVPSHTTLPAIFKTAHQVRDGIAGEMFPDDKQATLAPKEPTDAEKRTAEKTRREEVAQELLSLYPGSVQIMVADLLRDNKSWKTADAFYFGIEALTEKSGRRR